MKMKVYEITLDCHNGHGKDFTRFRTRTYAWDDDDLQDNIQVIIHEWEHMYLYVRVQSVNLIQ